MPSHLIRLILSVIFLQSCLAAWAGSPEAEPKLTPANQASPDLGADLREELSSRRLAEKGDKSAQKKIVEGRRTYTARLYGSLCLSCLKSLNAALNKRSGVFESIIDRAVKKEATDGQPATYEKWANAKVVYDASKISKDDITKRIKQSDFIVRRVEDVGTDEALNTETLETGDGPKTLMYESKPGRIDSSVIIDDRAFIRKQVK